MEKETFDVVEIFTSIQGEGKYAGHRATFVRFHGCDLNCSFCDEPKHKGKKFDTLSVWRLAEKITSLGCKLVIFTGGEPSLQLRSYTGETLLRLLKATNCRIHMETNGEFIRRGEVTPEFLNLFDFITYSPKNQDTLVALVKMMYVGADWTYEDKMTHDAELKLVAPTPDFEDIGYFVSVADKGSFKNKYLQPTDNSKESYLACSKTLDYYSGWQISLQQHKIFKIK